MQDAANHPQADSPAETFVIVDDESQPAEDSPRDDLDGLRIRRIAEMRRTTYRSASYCLVGTIACWVAAAQFIWLAVRHAAERSWGLLATGYLLLVPVAIIGGLRLWRRSRQLRREAAPSSLPPPETPPDFSSLHNGSQLWKNLEEMDNFPGR